VDWEDLGGGLEPVVLGAIRAARESEALVVREQELELAANKQFPREILLEDSRQI